jgi:voltage-gated sodium channel
MTKKIRKPIINDRILLILILLNVFIIYLHSFDAFKFYYAILDIIDVCFTIIFTLEITINILQSQGNNFKEKFLKFHNNKWNKIDFYSVLFAIPSIGVLFIEDLEIFAGFTILRSLRILKILRVIEFIPEGKEISSKLLKALKGVTFIIIAFIIYSTIISLISVTLFKSSAPSYFQNAFDSFFTIFKVFSGDGFSDIVAEISIHSSIGFIYFTKFYFVIIVFVGSILGLSLINSVFIDQMSTFEQKEQKEIKSLENKLDEILKNQELLFKEINEIKKGKDDI